MVKKFQKCTISKFTRFIQSLLYKYLVKKKIINTKYSNTFYQIEYIINNLYIVL